MQRSIEDSTGIPPSQTLIVIQTVVTSFFFFVEAMIHYNYGKTGDLIPTELPETHQLMRIVGTILFFSILSSVVMSQLKKRLGFIVS